MTDECKHNMVISDWQNKYHADPTNDKTIFACTKCELEVTIKDKILDSIDTSVKKKVQEVQLKWIS